MENIMIEEVGSGEEIYFAENSQNSSFRRKTESIKERLRKIFGGKKIANKRSGQSKVYTKYC